MVPSDLRSRAARLCRLRHDPQLFFPAPAPPPLNRRDHLDCRHRAMPIVTISIALGAHSAEKQGSHQRTLTYDEGVAIHIGPEPCVGVRKDADEASVGEGIGQPLSRESQSPDADAVSSAEGRGRAPAWEFRGQAPNVTLTVVGDLRSSN